MFQSELLGSGINLAQIVDASICTRALRTREIWDGDNGQNPGKKMGNAMRTLALRYREEPRWAIKTVPARTRPKTKVAKAKATQKLSNGLSVPG